MLGDGIYELRARAQRVNCRIIYFFHGKAVAVLIHGLTKEARIDAADIERARRRRQQFENDPEAHTHVEVTE